MNKDHCTWPNCEHYNGDPRNPGCACPRDKENDNAVRRLGSQSNQECGDETMCSMPETTGENEPGASESEAKGQGFLFRQSSTIAAFTAAFVGAFVVSIIISQMWKEDEIKLHVLNSLVKLLQSIARLCGQWALDCENAYNEYVNALH